MDWRENILQDISVKMGIVNFDFINNTFTLSFSEQFEIVIEMQDHGIFVYSIIPLISYDVLDSYLKALAMCHYYQLFKFFIQTALKDNNTLCLCIFFDNEEVTELNIINSIEFLIEKSDEVLKD